MLQKARILFCTRSRSEHHRRWTRAAVVFALLWITSILCIIFTSLRIVSVQALVLLNTAASLTAAIVTHSRCSRAGTNPNSPFVFGLYRLSSVVRLGSIIFLVFGCVETVVESLHSCAHAHPHHSHHSHPLVLFFLGSVQLLSQAVFSRDVRLVDRVIGHHHMAGAQSEDILHEVYAAAYRDGLSIGGESGFGEYRHPSDASVRSKLDSGSTVSPDATGNAQRTVHSSFTALLVYLLCPTTCILVSVLMLLTNSAIPDMAGSLMLAPYYAYVGCQQGRDMLNLLMNKCVADPWRLRRLEGCMRNVKVLDGVLQVHSTVWWDISVAESMLLTRVRLMSGSDACAVSRAVREHLTHLARYVYVECFPANGASNFGDNAQISWVGQLTSTHGHSHGDRDDGHGCGHHHNRMHSHSYASHDTSTAVKGEATSSSRIQANGFADIDSTTLSGPISAPGLYGARGFPEPAPPIPYTGDVPTSLTFPRFPASTSRASDSLAPQQSPMQGTAPCTNASQGKPWSAACGAANHGPNPTAASSSTGFPDPVSTAHSGDSVSQNYRMGHPVMGNTVGGGTDSTSFPAAPSSYLPERPHSVLAPYRELNSRIHS
ncbi:hypothetical protein JKF63_02549 [Porcisia hertigi]|uniref:Uncharacterized protein n=1 Tax=Porcisia hertigi TaxID=2761500 RepID=A0A836I9P9_9TRYP|nr:hypothetical protein JKF63_02549 [Porcisia hertigi]